MLFYCKYWKKSRIKKSLILPLFSLRHSFWHLLSISKHRCLFWYVCQFNELSVGIWHYGTPFWIFSQQKNSLSEKFWKRRGGNSIVKITTSRLQCRTNTLSRVKLFESNSPSQPYLCTATISIWNWVTIPHPKTYGLLKVRSAGSFNNVLILQTQHSRGLGHYKVGYVENITES